jgi:hypothetical protein
LLFFLIKINSQQTSIALRPGHRTDHLCVCLGAYALCFRIERFNRYKTQKKLTTLTLKLCRTSIAYGKAAANKEIQVTAIFPRAFVSS